MKGTVIFADKNVNEPKPVSNAPQQTDPKVMLSRDEYREVVKEAYKEGVKDALSSPPEKKQEQDSGEDKPSEDVVQTKNISEPEKQKSLEEGAKEAVKQHAKEQGVAKQKLKTITERHDIDLIRATTVFPFTFFPDTVIVDTTKVTIAKKQFFATEYISTIPLKEISEVTVQTAWFLGSITLQYMPQTESPGVTQPIIISVSSLKRDDAMRLKNIIKGVLVAKSESIDLTKLDPKEIIEAIEEFGKSENVV